jgi:hypothetical protein
MEPVFGQLTGQSLQRWYVLSVCAQTLLLSKELARWRCRRQRTWRELVRVLNRAKEG